MRAHRTTRSPARAAIGIAAACGAALSLSAADESRSPRLAPISVGAPVTETAIAAKDVDRAKRALEDPIEIRFRNGFVMRPEPGLGPGVAAPLGGIYLVQFPGPIDRERRRSIEDAGVRIHDYAQGHALIVEIPASGPSTAAEASQAILELASRGLIRHLGRLPAQAKISRQLATSGNGDLQVTAVLFRAPDEAGRRALDRWLRIAETGDGPPAWARGTVSARDVEALARIEAVRWIEPHSPSGLHNIEGTMASGADAVVGFGAYNGAGVRVAVDDTGIARPGTAADCVFASTVYHPDLPQGRIVDQWDFFDNDANACDKVGHGTHTAGTIGGAGAFTPDWRGVAPGVNFLVYRDCCDQFGHGFAHFDSVLTRAAAHDANVVANSWGGSNGVYTLDAFLADNAVRGAYPGSDGQPRRMVVTVSSGNDDDLTNSPGAAKNVITAGATKNGNSPSTSDCFRTLSACTGGCDCSVVPECGDTYQPASETICFSNGGPIDTDGDGHTRVKPDLVAPGTNIMSTFPPYFGGQLYTQRSGTSMAQPVIAGTAALMLQAYPGLADWPEALKARLLATAVSLGDPARFGHGMVDAVHAIYDADGMTTALWAANSVPGTGSQIDFPFSVPVGTKEVRVYLTWSDPPSLSTEVVDDLDLRVLDTGGNLVAASVSFDDTVESVRFAPGASAPGTWTGRVIGYNVPDGNTRFGIVAIVVGSFPGVVTEASSPTPCLAPGQDFRIDTNVYGSGAPTAATDVTLDLPDSAALFPFRGASIFTGDPGRQHTYQPADLPFDPVSNRYTMTIGLVSPVVPRLVSWGLTASAGLAEGSYTLPIQAQGYGTFPYVAVPAVTVDRNPPGPVGSLTSPDHVPGTCSNNPTVTTTWTKAPDGLGCGTAGYSIAWSAGAPALPDTTRDLSDVTSTSATLTPGTTSYYFNIRAVDGLERWSSDVRSWGPIRLDTTPPGYVTNLTSPTHPVQVCSDRSGVTMQWTGAPDDNCGLAGYSISWSESAPEVPDASLDIGTVQSWQANLPPSNFPRYFNIRSIDNAGNASVGAISYGPFFIDTVPGACDNFLLSPSGSDLSMVWDVNPDASFYRVFRATNPQFAGETQIGRDLATNSLLQTNGLSGADPIVYYRVLGVNSCGAVGP